MAYTRKPVTLITLYIITHDSNEFV